MPLRWILHVDMDAFYASVEARDDPSLAGVPLIVGGEGRRGVVASCSYEARVFGVRSAMPSERARRLCPQAVFVAGRHGRYAEVSAQLHAIFGRFTPLVEGISLDEAFLDVTGGLRLHGPAPAIAAAIRAQVAEELGLTCSVGVATVKFLAKLASEAAKPRVVDGRVEPGPGVYVVEEGRELEFLHPLPIEALWGVGPASAARLRRLGIVTIGDLAALPPASVESALGRAHGSHLALLARGLDDRAVEPDREIKSVSHEETYAHDRRDADGLHVEVVRMADSVGSRLRKAGLAGRTVTLKVRYGDFTTITRSATVPAAVDGGPEITRVASRLLDGVDVWPGVRLLGVGVSNLAPPGERAAEQLSLGFDGPPGLHAQVGPGAGGGRDAGAAGASGAAPATGGGPATDGGQGESSRGVGGRGEGERRAAAAAAVDAIRDRFGPAAVGPAALIGPAGIRVKRPGDTQWGPGRDPDGPAEGRPVEPEAAPTGRRPRRRSPQAS